MTIWIDPPAWPAHGRLWSHLISDTAIEELHAFAERAGLPRRGFEGDHYDIPQERYSQAVALGAHETSPSNIVRMLQDSGLRLRKRKGEKGIARVLGVGFPDNSRADIDLVRSALPTPDTATFAATVYVRERSGHWLAVWSPRRQEWSAPGGWRESGESPEQTAIRECLEESGIALPAGVLRQVGYERFYPLADTTWPIGDGRFLAVYRADITLDRPTLNGPDGEPSRWMSSADFLAAVADSWWFPMAETVVTSA
ncbi:DUF4031 domain-containing protein [Nostocoides veronense]|uniref:Nudix hydrolase domain-containing protein n=1 Tax=Nostocoides veronense TaxID=330836 RepID=A0ABP4XXE8_9MICO